DHRELHSFPTRRSSDLLGDFLSQFSTNGIVKKEHIPHNDLFFDGFKHQIKLANEYNGWFTEENILFALNNWSEALTESNITEFRSEEHTSELQSRENLV